MSLPDSDKTGEVKSKQVVVMEDTDASTNAGAINLKHRLYASAGCGAIIPYHSTQRDPARLEMASTVDQKRLKATKFPPEFDKKVDIEKVNIDLMKKWIANRITNILGDEDDIVVETCYNLVEQNQFPKIKEIQIQLTGFLGKDTATFCKELWDLMLSAQESPMGVPRELLEAKKLELQREQPLPKLAAWKRRSRTTWLTLSAEANVQTDQSVVAAEVEASVEATEEGEAEEETLIEDRRDVIRDRLQGGDRRHRVANVTSTFPVVEVIHVEDVVLLLASAVAHVQAIAPCLLHLVVHAAHPRQIDHEHRHDAAHDRPLPTVPDHHLAVRDVLHDLGDGETGHGPPATTAGGYPGILRDLFPLQSNRAHQRPGCQYRVPEHRLDVVADRLLAHDQEAL
ncbi:hypothetical protein IAQ61_004460 [Plenodomus lingam]|uniref:PWI domain-containing protein n=1 Tax=Leptosphaeria maculans (strain JN3 / isolate v23.1.3 / race Av1-4-5-6-7-8) TaxID=985895 RepID=E4ZVK8_LEPMJ|nr:hypothetical protein LEMA_P027860.1 [Plenodomus lingam JN3]KAH9873833.1 hypothetical protein IAQ61_004460 [Plenodomus lingam]CBX95634.1 hypothetical protein LEMA_P027860.1 [Plenodomus lingam JN3]